MPLDPRAKRFLDTLAAMQPPSALSLSVAERRHALNQLLSFSGVPPQIASVRTLSVPARGGPVAVRIYQPLPMPGAIPAAFIYFHGGGLVAGSLDSHDAIGRCLSAATGAPVLSVDYPLGPERPFPAGIEEGLDACRAIAAQAAELGIAGLALGICGDSAGATLAAVICQELARTGDLRVAFQFLLCPITDFAEESESRRRFAEGYLVDRATLQHDLKYYLAAGGAATDARVSPLRAAALGGLPPAVVHTAEFDPLRDEGRAYAERLEAAGVRTIYRCHPGMIHLFYGMGGLVPYARTAYALMADDVRALLA